MDSENVAVYFIKYLFYSLYCKCDLMCIVIGYMIHQKLALELYVCISLYPVVPMGRTENILLLLNREL